MDWMKNAAESAITGGHGSKNSNINFGELASEAQEFVSTYNHGDNASHKNKQSERAEDEDEEKPSHSGFPQISTDQLKGYVHTATGLLDKALENKAVSGSKYESYVSQAGSLLHKLDEKFTGHQEQSESEEYSKSKEDSNEEQQSGKPTEYSSTSNVESKQNTESESHSKKHSWFD